jgi:hypothetical protein
MPEEKFNPKKRARAFLKEAVELLEEEARNGKGIARLEAIKTLLKLAEVEAVSPPESPEVEFEEIDGTECAGPPEADDQVQCDIPRDN